MMNLVPRLSPKRSMTVLLVAGLSIVWLAPTLAADPPTPQQLILDPESPHLKPAPEARRGRLAAPAKVIDPTEPEEPAPQGDDEDTSDAAYDEEDEGEYDDASDEDASDEAYEDEDEDDSDDED